MLCKQEQISPIIKKQFWNCFKTKQNKRTINRDLRALTKMLYFRWHKIYQDLRYEWCEEAAEINCIKESLRYVLQVAFNKACKVWAWILNSMPHRYFHLAFSSFLLCLKKLLHSVTVSHFQWAPSPFSMTSISFSYIYDIQFTQENLHLGEKEKLKNKY